MTKKTAPETVTDRRHLVVVYALKVLLLVMALLQLVSFEAFAQTLATTGVASMQGGVLLAVTLLALEIFSLPFLLRLWLSPLTRAISAVCVLLVPAIWLALILQTTFRTDRLENLGLFGSFIEVPSGGLALGIGVLLALLAVWSFKILNGPKVVQLR